MVLTLIFIPLVLSLEKWIKSLKKDIKFNKNLSGLSIKCLHFLLCLIETNPLNRLKNKDILTHPFLTEEINDKLGIIIGVQTMEMISHI